MSLVLHYEKMIHATTQYSTGPQQHVQMIHVMVVTFMLLQLPVPALTVVILQFSIIPAVMERAVQVVPCHAIMLLHFVATSFLEEPTRIGVTHCVTSVSTTTTSIRADVRICQSGDCANAQFDDESIYCDNKNNAASTRVCQSSIFTNSFVFCDSGSCQDSIFENTDVTCSPLRLDDSCNNSIFNRTTASCSGDSCDNSDFYASAITCSSFDSCDNSGMYFSCCDGSGCPSSALSCDDTDGFCSNLFLGRTYKDWGNPICASVSTTTSSVRDEVVICRSGDCASTQFDDASVYCDNKDNAASTRVCQSATFSNSLVYCEAGACQTSSFTNTVVTLVSSSSGDDSTFTRSSVACSGDSCDRARFISSEASCPSFDSCDNASFDECSCCDGTGCPSTAPSCSSDVATFCSRTLAGQQCSQLGNPVCGDLGSPTAPVDTPTSNPASAPPPGPLPTTRPVSAPTPSPVRSPVFTPTQPPNAPPVAVSTSPPQQPASPSETDFSIALDTPFTIPPDDTVGSVRVVSNPRNGNLVINQDNSLTYTPNPGFVGVDVFSVEYCDDVDNCRVIVFEMTVTTDASESSGDGGSGGLYGLAALALIPIAIVAIFLWKRKRSGAVPQTKDPNEITQGPSEAGPSHASGPGHSSISDAESGMSRLSAPMPPPPSRPTSSVPLTNKDQVGTHVLEQQGQDVAVEGVATLSGPSLSLDSVDDSTPANQTTSSDSYQPTAKDQCRTVVGPNGEVPIVSAVEVESEPPKRKALEP